MRFDEAYEGWNSGRLTQAQAGLLLGMCERSFRRYLSRYEAEGLDGLIDRRLEQISSRRAPADEGMALTERYRSRHSGWNVKHFHSWYKRDGGTRSYTWVKKRLQEATLVPKAKKRGAHRKRRGRSALPGMMIHQDGSTHEWVAGQKWDLIVTMDDATSEHYSMFFVDEEGTTSSFRGVQDVIAARGLFSSFYSDRGNHYWHTPEAGGKVDKENRSCFGLHCERRNAKSFGDCRQNPQRRSVSRRNGDYCTGRRQLSRFEHGRYCRVSHACLLRCRYRRFLQNRRHERQGGGHQEWPPEFLTASVQRLRLNRHAAMSLAVQLLSQPC